MFPDSYNRLYFNAHTWIFFFNFEIATQTLQHETYKSILKIEFFEREISNKRRDTLHLRKNESCKEDLLLKKKRGCHNNSKLQQAGIIGADSPEAAVTVKVGAETLRPRHPVEAEEILDLR